MEKSSLFDFYFVSLITVIIAISQIAFDLEIIYLGFQYLLLAGLILYISVIKYQNLLSLKTLFLLGNFFVFFIPLIYISIVYNGQWTSYKYTPVTLYVEDIKTIALLVGVSISAFLFGYLLSSHKIRQVNIETTKYNKVMFCILIVSFFVLAYRRYDLIKFVSQHGFDAIYSTGYSTSLLESVIAYVFIILAPVAYLTLKSYKLKNIVLFMILIEALLHGLAGQRVWILVGIIQTLFLININAPSELNRNMWKRIKLILYLLFFAFISIYVMTALLFYREGLEFNISSFSIIDYFVGQFGTIVGLKIAIENPRFIYGSTLPPILDTLNIFRSTVQGNVDETTSNIGSRVTYISCASCLEQGKSYGASIYMQLYQFGYFGVALGCVFLGYLAKLIDMNKHRNYVYSLLGFFLAKHFLWSARGEYFPHYINVAVIILSVVMLSLFLKKYLWKNNNESH